MEKNKKIEKDIEYIPKILQRASIRELLEHEMKTRSLYGNAKIRYSVSSTAVN